MMSIGIFLVCLVVLFEYDWNLLQKISYSKIISFYMIIKKGGNFVKKLHLFTFLVILSFMLNVSISFGTLVSEWHEEQGMDPNEDFMDSYEPGERILEGIPKGGVLLIPDSGQNRVMAFDPETGDLLDANFIPAQDEYLTTPIHIILCVDETSFLITDQVRDIVQRFSLEGEYIEVFAPAGGVDNTILDNIRGMLLRENGNYLVTVASGGNAHAIPEFDDEGNFLGNFITAGLGGLAGPWSIIYREQDEDYLISASTSNAIHRYDSDGDFIDLFVSSINFPEQMQELDNGNVLVATFSAPSGVYEFDSDGEQIGFYGPVTGLRGVYELGNGNILITNSQGVHEIDRDGQLVETKLSGVNARFISFITTDDEDHYTLTLDTDPDDIGAELTGAGSYPEGEQVDIEVSLENTYTFIEWTGSADDVALLDDPYSMATFFAMPDRNLSFTAVFDADGPDASISSDDISYYPDNPLPGDTVEITARIYNLGDIPIDSGDAEFYYSIEPDVDLQYIETYNFGSIEPSEYIDITIDWETSSDMDPRIYIITVILTDIEPYDINPDNNSAYFELALPVELASFTAIGIGNRANIRWVTLSETDNLGFNLYRLNISNVNPYIAFLPVKLNDSLIPGQGTSTTPHFYAFTDYGINRFFDYIYILETVSTYGERTEYRTSLLRLGLKEAIIE